MGQRREVVVPVVESWSSYWAICAVGGAVAACLFYVLGGWWYRLRIRWSGAVNPDASLSRRVYILASMVYAFPTVLLGMVYSAIYPTPLAAAWESPLWADLGVIVFLFWSVYTSYRGVRSLFDVDRWKARGWFLILPTVFYLIALGGVALLLGLLAAGVVGEAPDVDRPNVLNRPTCVLQYPGNWSINRTDGDYVPDYSFTIEPLFLDALIMFDIADEPTNAEEETAFFLEQYRNEIPGRVTSRFSRWGRYTGSGVEYTGELEGSRIRLRIFTVSLASRNVTVTEIVEVTIADKVEPGFALIRRTFRLRE
jgi:hypothetical protein